MKKGMVLRGTVGFFVGVTIGQFIPMISSLIYGDGNYYPVTPALAESCGTELSAVLLQFVLCGIMGICFGAGSMIWEIDSWSILKQTIVHLLLSSVVMFPVAYLMQWMERSIKGIAVYVGIFIGIYVVVWFTSYLAWWGKINRLNVRMKDKL